MAIRPNGMHPVAGSKTGRPETSLSLKTPGVTNLLPFDSALGLHWKGQRLAQGRPCCVVATPGNPSDPCDPCDPSNPCDPSDPSDPSDLSDPSDPSDL
jgi:hypothetical protein